MRNEIADLAGLLAWRRCVQASFPHSRSKPNSVQWLACDFSPYSRAAATARVFGQHHEERSVFPYTKSAMIVMGQLRPLWDTWSHGKFPWR